MLFRRNVRHDAVQLVRTLLIACFLPCLVSAQAAAAPSFDVDTERDMPTVSHSDERVDYTVNVRNAASANPSTGDELFCDRGSSSAEGFSHQWIRNGVSLESAEDIAHGSQTDTYTVQAADEGAAVQCVVKGTNESAPGVFVSAVRASLPATIVEPKPSPEPPTGSGSPTLKPAAAIVFNETTESFEHTDSTSAPFLTCEAPESISGTDLTWSFRWLRNGEEVGTENVVETTSTSSKYELQPADAYQVLQCAAIASDANVSIVAHPGRKPIEATNPPGTPQATISFLNATSGQVTLEIKLPGGAETRAFRFVDPTAPPGAEASQPPDGWSCSAILPSGVQPAKAVCTRSDTLEPGQSYPGVKVVTALGADAPDVAVAEAMVFGGGAAESASAVDEFTFAPPRPFGLTVFEAELRNLSGDSYTQAGGHPFSGVGIFEFTKKRKLVPIRPQNTHVPIGNVKQVFTDLPRGQVGNALAVPELCPSVDDVPAPSKCPPASAVGGINIRFSNLGGAGLTVPVYAIEPEFGTPAQFAFADFPAANVYTLSARLRPGDNYAVSLDLAPAPIVEVLSSKVTLCNFGLGSITPDPVDPDQNPAAVNCKEADDPAANAKPLFTNPTRCDVSDPPTVRVRLNSWENQTQFAEHSFTTPPITGCEVVPFDPEIDLRPTSQQADSATGLDIDLEMPTDGLEDPEGISQANLEGVRIAFPVGMSVNASAGHGLQACGAAEIKLGTNDPITCPEASKIGTVEIETPLIKETLTGSVYVAKQGEVDGSLIGLYLVFESAKDGIIIKIPSKVTPDPGSGQLVATVDNSPEAPFSAVRMRFPQGPRATLLAPQKCGNYKIEAELTPWNAKDPANPTAAEVVSQSSMFQVRSGPGGGRCSRVNLEPNFSAGTVDPVAGKTSPFVMRLTREDGSQRFASLDLTTPSGLVAYLRGVPYCPEATLATISSAPGTGQAQIDNPSCPAASQIGVASAGAGAGANPFYVNTGKAYLAGPYKGAPLSLVLVTPAVAGPLDLGNVVVRTALYVDPRTARITAVADPIPTILHGILLNIRDIRVAIDRPGFMLNPTNCDPMAIDARVGGEGGASTNVSSRFQVAGCENLGFKPRLSLRLFGGTRRAAYQGLRAVVRPRPGDANIGRTVVRMPRSAFLAQEHIRTVCTRVQFAAEACPKGAVYGKAIAYSPLLDFPLRGDVYLRSSDNELPDLVADLKGPPHLPVRIELVGRTDSIKGALRNTFDVVPDAPVSYFRLQLFGGNKGLIINSRNICRGKNRAVVNLTGQNGRRQILRPVLRNRRCGRRKAKLRKGHGRAKQSLLNAFRAKP